eukprot:5725051-Pleurochrysis_carterae.AAC.1
MMQSAEGTLVEKGRVAVAPDHMQEEAAQQALNIWENEDEIVDGKAKIAITSSPKSDGDLTP